MTTFAPASDAALDLTCRALGHVLDVDPTSLRADSPLADLGADSVAILVFADVVEGFAASAALTSFKVRNDLLIHVGCVGDLASCLVWDQATAGADTDGGEGAQL
jgi:hypothetical protein